ncbi:MAG: hypothetical protein KGS61_03910, partial [Verrucomicrobia bacterium]|nr:hypothetical protein [Verrucomicrobiota bacterium]
MTTHLKWWQVGLLGAVLGWTEPAARAEIIYDNSYYSEGTFFPGLLEYGDEINLVGSARTVVDFRFEYYGEFDVASNQTVRLRLYANNGPGAPGFQAPGTVLFDSGTFAITPGYHTVAFSGLSVVVSNQFTWTVQFAGVTNQFGARAGLTFYNPPVAGSSFDDFWQNVPDTNTPPNYTWNLFHFGGSPVANFSAKVTALPDPAISVVSQTPPTNGMVRLDLSGPLGRDFVLQASSNQVDWMPLSTNTLTRTPLSLVDSNAARFGPVFYRAQLLPEPAIHLLSPSVLTNADFKLLYDGPEGRHAQIEVSTNLVDWSILGVRTLIGEAASYVDVYAPAYSNGFYRGTLLSDPPTVIGTNFSLSNGQFQIPLNGPPGQDFMVQASTDLVSWTAIATNTFTFTQGYADFVDPAATNFTHRFYWIVLLP